MKPAFGNVSTIWTRQDDSGDVRLEDISLDLQPDVWGVVLILLVIFELLIEAVKGGVLTNSFVLDKSFADLGQLADSMLWKAFENQ